MSKLWAFIGVAAAIGTGYFLGKKLMEENPELVSDVKENCTEKFRTASEYCADAVKTGSEKLSKNISKIVETSKEKSSDIAKKAKSATTDFKDELNSLKDKIVSSGKGADVDFFDEDEEAGFVPEDEFIEEALEEPEEGSEAL